MVCDVWQGHDRAIVWRRECAVIHRREALSSHLAKMKMPHRSCCIGRQLLQYAEPIQNLLAVGLENFPAQTGRRPWRLLQHDILDALLRQRQAEHGPASARADDDDVRPFRHFQSWYRSMSFHIERNLSRALTLVTGSVNTSSRSSL